MKWESNYVLTGKDLLDMNVTSISMLLDPIIQKQGVGVLVGGSDSGKSYLMLDLAMAICSNQEEIHGYRIKKTHGSVLYVATEDDENIISYRMGRLAKNKSIEGEKIRFVFQTDGSVVKIINEELTRQPVDIVIIDTMGDLFEGNINQGVEFRKFLRPYKEVANQHKCFVLFLHHVSKARESNVVPDKNDASGSEAIQSACRVVMNLKKLPDGKRQLTVVKGNNIDDSLKGKGLILSFDPEKGFTVTGQQVNFQSTDSQVNGIRGYDPKIADLVIKLYKELKSYQKVSDELKKQGYKIDKNKVGQYVKHASSDPKTEG